MESSSSIPPIAECRPVDPDRFREEIVASERPVVMRGLAADWPAVQAALQSDEALVRYLQKFDAGRPVEVLIGPPEIDGRFFYDDAMAGCNFQKRFGSLSALLDKLLHLRTVDAPQALYAGAAAAGANLPGWSDENPFPFPIDEAVPRIWVGNRTHTNTHFDESANVAIVIGGRRRFTLFPPEQVDNLYVGPLHFTIAGPPVSMVDLRHLDLELYPRFADALEHAVTAELGPGDALFIPPLWWHNVEALDGVNVMMNYWWESPLHNSGIAALVHAVLSLRDLPPAHRAAWRHWFDRMVFDEGADHAVDHLPPAVRGPLGPASIERNNAIRRQFAAGVKP